VTTKGVEARKGKVVYFSHGGGPLPILGDESHRAMIEFMEHLPSSIGQPEAIVVISAHWEESIATVLGASTPAMLYDYYGFPEEAYQIKYPAPGHPALASRIVRLLQENGIEAGIDKTRGFDHGLYIPLKMMYPQAEIPSIQLSLIKGLDPARHLVIGNALKGLMKENILVIGSGFSFHNMQAFSWDGKNTRDTANDAFQDWLDETCTAQLPYSERQQRLLHWLEAPSARYCHPREEHLLPLHVCAGIAAENIRATKIFDDYILGKRAVAFQW